MAFTMMPLEFLEIFIVNVLQFRTVQVTYLAFKVSTHLQVYFEGLKIIKSSGTKFTMRVIKRYFACSTRFSLFEMYLKLIICVKFLLRYHAFSILETNITILLKTNQN